MASEQGRAAVLGGRSTGADAYEAANMAPRGAVIHRDKLVARGVMIGLGGAALFFAALGVGVGLSSAPFGAAVGLGAVLACLTGLSLFMALTRSVLRSVVTRDELRIHWGLWGPSIPIASIRALRRRPATRTEMVAAASEPGRPPVEIYQVPVPAAEALEIEWGDSSGKARRVWLGAQDVRALESVLSREMARLSTRALVSTSGDRVAIGESDPIADDAVQTEPSSSDARDRTASA